MKCYGSIGSGSKCLWFKYLKESYFSDLGKLVSEIYQNGLTIAKAKQTILKGRFMVQFIEDKPMFKFEKV